MDIKLSNQIRGCQLRKCKNFVNTIADVSHQYEHYAGKLRDRNQCVAKHFSKIRRWKKNEAIEGTHMRVAAIPSEFGYQEQMLDKLHTDLYTDPEHIFYFNTDTLLMFDVTRK